MRIQFNETKNIKTTIKTDIHLILAVVMTTSMDKALLIIRYFYYELSNKLFYPGDIKLANYFL